VTRPIYEDALAHHVWATLRLFDACAALSDGQVRANEPGIYGSILATLGHLVGADAWYLNCVTGGQFPEFDDEAPGADDLAILRAQFASHADAWRGAAAAHRDPDEVIGSPMRNGGRMDATTGIRFAQVVHHGTDHRSQICTALTHLGVEPPSFDVWDYGQTLGVVIDIPPS
jgi:uncharacterized damage-inducible protein DinB